MYLLGYKQMLPACCFCTKRLKWVVKEPILSPVFWLKMRGYSPLSVGVFTTPKKALFYSL